MRVVAVSDAVSCYIAEREAIRVTYTLADLTNARRQALDAEAWLIGARSQIAAMEREGRDTADAQVLLGQLEKARRQSIERLGSIRRLLGPSAY